MSTILACLGIVTLAALCIYRGRLLLASERTRYALTDDLEHERAECRAARRERDEARADRDAALTRCADLHAELSRVAGTAAGDCGPQGSSVYLASLLGETAGDEA